MRSLRFALALAAPLAASPFVHAQAPPMRFELDKLLASNGQSDSSYGGRIDIEGDFAVVGVPRDDHAGPDGGSAYVYRHVAGAWIEEAIWFPQNGYLAGFGESVSISGDRVAVGALREAAPSANEGAVYVYHHDGVAWSLEARLVQNNSAYANLGDGVAIDGDLLVGGAPLDFVGGIQKGAAYVWRRGAGGWTLEATLAPSDGTSAQGFGNEIAAEGDVIAVGARYAAGVTSGSGAVYVFERAAGVWSQTAKLIGSSLGPNQGPWGFGADLDLETGRLVVGCPDYRGAHFSTGLVFEYLLQGGVWIEAGHLEASDAALYTFFGRSVSLDGPRVLVGADGAFGLQEWSGAGYLFENVGGVWLERVRLAASDAAAEDAMGRGCALGGGRALLGAPNRDDLGRNSGAVYEFDIDLPGIVGTAYCFGDGTGTACPCGNDSPAGSGRGCVNSSGEGAWLEAVGTTSLAAADLGLYARALPARQPCLLFAGENALAGGLGVTFGDGLRCVGGSVKRLGIGFGGATGVAAWAPDLSVGTPWGPGSTVRLQAWYRDPTSGPCAQEFNLTNGLEVLLAP